MFTTLYLQPVAYHRDAPERLLLTDEAGAWFLWFGDERGLTDVPDLLAQWVLGRSEMISLSGDLMWFDVSSLPVVPVPTEPAGHPPS